MTRARRALAAVAAAVLLPIVTACGPPAEPCRGFATADVPALAAEPDAAVGVALYQAAIFPEGAKPVRDELTSDRAVYRITKSGSTIGWITLERTASGWGSPQGTTCKERPTTGQAPPTSVTTTR